MNWIDKIEMLKETIGAENALQEICRAMGTFKAEELLDYILNLYELIPEEDD